MREQGNSKLIEHGAEERPAKTRRVLREKGKRNGGNRVSFIDQKKFLKIKDRKGKLNVLKLRKTAPNCSWEGEGPGEKEALALHMLQQLRLPRGKKKGGRRQQYIEGMG